MQRRYICKFLVFSCLIFLVCSGCGGSSKGRKQDKESLPKKLSEESTPEDPAALLKERAIDQIEAYYQALEREEITVSEFFAPQVARFFGGENLTRAEIERSLTQGFQTVESRRLSIDEASVNLTETAAGYEVVFSGTSESTNSQTKARTQGSFQNRIIFNRDWLITHYLPAESSTKTRGGLAARVDTRSGAAMNVANRTLAAFRDGDIGSLADLVHPELGYYLIASPGAMNVPRHYTNIEDILTDAPWFADGNRAIDPRPTEAELPSFSCDDYFSKEGCFMQSLSQPYTDISSLTNDLQQADLIDASDFSDTSLQSLEAQVSIQIVDTDAFIAFYLGQIDGSWYLLVVDPATYDCSA